MTIPKPRSLPTTEASGRAPAAAATSELALGPSPRVGYRDYLKNQYVLAAQATDYGSVPSATFEVALRRRFHQEFLTIDEAPAPAAALLAHVLIGALVAPVAEGGFGLPGDQLPAQGQTSDDDYFAQLLALTGISTRELRNRYRVSFDRQPGESSSPVDLNIEALRGLLTDSFQSSFDGVGVVPVNSAPPGSIVPFDANGSAPFFLEYTEWQQRQQPFYPENLFDIHHALPWLDGDFRTTVDNYPSVLFPGTGYFDDLGELPASTSWLHSLFGLFDTFEQVFPALDEQNYAHANDLLSQLDGMLGTALAALAQHPRWNRARFDWDAGGVQPTDAERLIGLQDRASLTVDTMQQFNAFEAYFAAPPLRPFTGQVEDEATRAHREMWLARARSLFVSDLLYLQFVALPYLRARIAAEQGAYAEALRWLRLLTGYPVGVAELTSTTPYAATPAAGLGIPLYELDSLPYTALVTFDSQHSSYRDHVVEIAASAAGQVIEFPLAPFERRHFKLQQAEIMLTWADRQHRAGGAGTARARELYKGVLFVHNVDPDLAPHFSRTNPPPIGFGGVNPALASQVSRANLGLDKIDHGLNAYGYSDDFVPLLRYRPLKDAADRFAGAAKSAENEFIEYIARLEQAQIDEAQAQSLADKADIGLQIAHDQQANAQFEVDRAQEQLASLQAAITAKQQEIADSDSLFNQAAGFLSKAVGETMGDLLDSTGKLVGASGNSAAVTTYADYSRVLDLASSDFHLNGDTLSKARDIASSEDFMLSFVSFGVVGYTALASMASEDNRREAELASLLQHDLPLAQSVVALKQRDKQIADLEAQIALAERDFAQWLLAFQRERFLSRAFWKTLAGLTGRLMRRYIELGARTAWFAERALAFEQTRTLHIIRLDYLAPRLRDITGADLLQADLAELEAARLNGVRLTTPITRTLSLARDFPTAFATLKGTGACRFRTSESMLRPAYPGTFGYRIRTITAVAQSLRAVSARGILSNTGHSIVSGEDPVDQTPISRFPDALPLSDFSLRTDATVYGFPNETLLQFEGSGFETSWQLTFPVAGNPQGLSALADVLLTFDLLAYWTPHAASLAAAGAVAPSSASLLLSAASFDPAAARLFQAGDASAIVSFDLQRTRLPRPITQTIANVGVVAVGLPPLLSPVTATVSIGGTSASAPLSGNVALSNAGRLAGTQPASPLNAVVGQSVAQAVQVSISAPDGVTLPGLRDIVLYVDLESAAVEPAPNARWQLLLPSSSTSQPRLDRVGHTAVYDPASRRMIVFGGGRFEELGFTNDVEVLIGADGNLDDSTWLTLALPSEALAPMPRNSHSAVYDGATNRMIVFGGSTGVSVYVNDVWVLSNANGVGGSPEWIQLSPAGSAPPPRRGHTAVFDGQNNRMIVFGGATTDELFSDVWVLTNANGQGAAAEWINLQPGGPAPVLADHGAVYDVANNTMLVFGGYVSAQTFEPSNALWALASANGLGGVPIWSSVGADARRDGAPPARFGHSVAFDADRSRLLVFGGADATGTNFFDDVWILQGVGAASMPPRWHNLQPTGVPPAPRVYHSAVYEPNVQRMIVYAGGSTEGTFFSVWGLDVSAGP